MDCRIGKLRKIDYLFALIIFFVALFFFGTHSTVSLQPSDGAELVTAAVRGAIVHPPGYPLYSIITWSLVKALSIDPIVILASFSYLCQALSVIVLFFICRRLSADRVVALCLTVVWVFYAPVIRTATDIEVFALHHLLVLGLLWLIIEAWFKDSLSKLFYFALGCIGGLGLSNHHTIVLWFPIVIAFFYQRSRKADALVSALFSCLSGTLLTMCCYFYLLLPRTLDQAVAFAGLSSFSELKAWFLRAGYGTFSLWSGDGSQTESYLKHFFLSNLWINSLLLILVFVLLIRICKQPSSLLIGIFASALMHIVFVTQIMFPAGDPLFQDTASRFYAVVMLSIVLVSSLAFVNLQMFFSKLYFVLLASLALIFAPVSLSEGDARSDQLLEAELDAIVRELPQGAVFIATADRIAMGMQYRQLVMGQRTDIKLIIRGLLPSSSYRSVLVHRHPYFGRYAKEQLLDFNSLLVNLTENDILIFSMGTQKLTSSFNMYPIGVTWQWLPKEVQVESSEVISNLLRFCSSWTEQLDGLPEGRVRSRHNRELSFTRNFSSGLSLLTAGETKDFYRSSLELLQSGKSTLAAQRCSNALAALNITSSNPIPYAS